MSSFSQIKIANMAIRQANGNPINAIPDGAKKEGLIIDNFWNFLVDFLLGLHPWKFAKLWLSLAPDEAYTMVDDQYDYAYVVPSDLIRFVRTESAGTVFVRRQGHYLCNASPLIIEYVSRISDTTKWPDYFVSLMVDALALRLFFPMSTKGSFEKKFKADYADSIAYAKERDYREDQDLPENTQGHTTDNDTWIGAWG
jgi:hypothetical protein